MVFVFLLQTYFPKRNMFQVRVLANDKISFFLWLSNIPLCVCVCVCVCIHHIFVIHSSVDEHLGCWHILAIVNNAVVNTGLHVSFQITVFIFFECIPRSGIAGSYGSLICSFLRKLHSVSTVAAPIYITTNNVLGFPLLHILDNICYL